MPRHAPEAQAPVAHAEEAQAPGAHAPDAPGQVDAGRRQALRGLSGAALAASFAGCADLTGARAPVEVKDLTPPTLPPPGLPAELHPPASPREFRAAWVASVANIDWPSRPGLPAAAWRAEAVAMLDRAKSLGLNAIVLQVRPAADALYASALEPWSEYLTGQQGRPPAAEAATRAGSAEPSDPLALWVAEAHRRGLELHAWFNPYRARHPSAKGPLAASHVAQVRPQAVKRYGDMLWMDPAEPDAVAQTLAVVDDVVRRYDIDGVHIDDYFYPYPIKAEAGGAEAPEQPFPDDPAWLRYLSSGGTLDRAGWRREQVDRLVQALHRTVHQARPWVRFGISPFGLGKPALRPPGIVGFSQYDKLYADVERWMQQGWLDYLAPQLYWPMDREGQAFAPLLDYWLGQNPHGRHVWPGLFTSMVGSGNAAPGSALPAKGWPAREVLRQIEHSRTRLPRGEGGHLHFSMVALMQDRDGLAEALRTGLYAQPALVPATTWLAGPDPDREATGPRLARQANGSVAIEARPGARAATRWSVWRRRGEAWRFEVHGAVPGARVTGAAGELLVVRPVDALGLEGLASVLRPGDEAA